MASSIEQDFASMSEGDLIFQQMIQQVARESAHEGADTPANKAATKAAIDRDLKQINEALKRRRANESQKGSCPPRPKLTTSQGSSSSHPGKPTASSMSRYSTFPWNVNGAGGSGSKKRTFETNIGSRSPPRPSKVHRPTPSPHSSAFTTPSKDDWSWNEMDSSSLEIIDLTDDSEDLVKVQREKERAEEERRRKRKQQEDADAEFARALQQMGEDSSPIPGPSSIPNTFDHIPDLQGYSYGSTNGFSQHVKAEPSPSFRHDMNSLSGFQPETLSSYGLAGSHSPQQTFGESSNMISKTKSRMPGSFIDDLNNVDDDDLFGDKLFGMDGDPNPSYQEYNTVTDNSESLPPSELARQAALRRRQEQFSDPWTNNSGPSTGSTPIPGVASPFTSASQVWNNQSLQRPGFLMNGSANPIDFDGSVYTNSYNQSGSGANLSDIISRTSTNDYVNGVNEFGNPLDPRVLDVANGDEVLSEEEGIRRLLANIGSSAEDLGDDEIADPKGLKYPLYKHQRQALYWMTRMEKDVHKKGGILADDMGLGKTISSLSLIVSRHPVSLGKTSVKTKTTLIIAPVSLVDQWRREISTKLKRESQLRVFKYHGVKSGYEDLRVFDVVITTYGTVASEMTRLEEYMKSETSGPKDGITVSQKFPLLGPRSLWYRVIVDEAQCIKNAKTKNAKAVHQLKSEYRWCLTGTPMMNNVSELSSLITFLRIEPYCAPDKFKRAFGCLSHKTATGGYHRNDAMRQLQVLLKALMLRRTKNSKIDDKPIINLPPKIEEQVHVVFDEDEAKFYKDLEQHSQVQFNRYLKGGAVGKKYTIILTLLLRLRQACCHPYLHLTDLDYTSNSEAREDIMMEHAKGMSSEVVNRVKETDSFECPICYDAVENPLFILPCGHATCPECFTRLTDGSNEQAVQAGQENAKTLCPQCRGPVDPKKTITYDIFKKVYCPEPDSAKVEEVDDVEYETDTDYDSEFDDPGFKGDEDKTAYDVNKKGNLKGFIDDGPIDDEPTDDEPTDDEHIDDERIDMDTKDMDDDIRNATHKETTNESDDALEYSESPGVSQLVSQHMQKNSKGKDKTRKPKKVRPKGKKKETEVKPHMLKALRQNAGRNKSAHKKYMHFLKQIWEPSAKVTKCKEIIADIQSTGEKTIVFSQWTLLLDLLEIPLKHELNVKYRRYDGSMSAAMRVNAANDFTDLPDVKVILVSLKAGNAGLNLNSASHVIIMDPFWNPYIEMQAVDRAHRIGQQRTVQVHRILIKDTVEDRIITLQNKKRDIIENALDPEVAKSISSLGVQELAYLFGTRQGY